MQDLEALGVKELRVKKSKDKVDISSLKDHPALVLSFETILQGCVSEMYEVMEKNEYIWLKYKG